MLARAAGPEPVAAAVCWAVGKGNQRFGQRPGELRVKDLMSYLGLSQASAADRGYQVLRAAGIGPASGYGDVSLGSPRLLVSARRREIIELRDRHRARLAGAPRG
jgi:hypothetical protein